MVKFIQLTSKLFRIQYHHTINITTTFLIRRHLSNQINQFKMEKIIAIGQMRSTNNKLDNRQQVQQIVELAAQENASVRTLFLLFCVFNN